jgi:hypothetical protein
MAPRRREIIVVRSLADSDLGLFETHRKAATSKQRAIALTTLVAKQLLSPDLFSVGGTEMDCICVFGSVSNREPRYIGKVGKNWRLGGHQLKGKEFADLDSKDFILLRSIGQNDATRPVMITFVGRRAQSVMHAGVVAIVKDALRQSVAVYTERSPSFAGLAALFPSVPAGVALKV